MADHHLTTPAPQALTAALKSALACILGAEALATYRPDAAEVLALLDGVERYLAQARAALAATEGA
ncbi:hypothetical protein [Thauera mechernichensis]